MIFSEPTKLTEDKSARDVFGKTMRVDKFKREHALCYSVSN